MESFCCDTLHDASYIPKNLERKAGLHLSKATNIVFQNGFYALRRLVYVYTEKSTHKKKDVQNAHLFLLACSIRSGEGWDLVSISIWFKRTFYSYANIICLVLI